MTRDVGSPENFISFALIRRKLFHLNTATFTPSLNKGKKNRILISNAIQNIFLPVSVIQVPRPDGPGPVTNLNAAPHVAVLFVPIGP